MMKESQLDLLEPTGSLSLKTRAATAGRTLGERHPGASERARARGRRPRDPWRSERSSCGGENGERGMARAPDQLRHGRGARAKGGPRTRRQLGKGVPRPREGRGRDGAGRGRAAAHKCPGPLSQFSQSSRSEVRCGARGRWGRTAGGSLALEGPILSSPDSARFSQEKPHQPTEARHARPRQHRIPPARCLPPLPTGR